jgi:hypothetical protein
MKALENRISRLEQAHGLSQPDGHVIPILFYPGSVTDDTFEPWLAEQLRCDCTPGCPGKRVHLLLPQEGDAP